MYSEAHPITSPSGNGLTKDRLLSQQAVHLGVDQLAVFQVVLLQVAFWLEAAFFQHPCRSRIEGEDVGRDLEQMPFCEGKRTDVSHHSGHYTSAPIGLGQPVTDLG